MPIHSSIKLSAEINNLRTLIDYVSNSAGEKGFASDKISKIELATEEVFVNICNHAYKGEKGDVEVTCSFDGEERFVVEIVDSGPPFDMLSSKNPDITSDISERSVGGLGLLFIKQIMDEVTYKRENDKNILSLVVLKN